MSNFQIPQPSPRLLPMPSGNLRLKDGRILTPMMHVDPVIASQSSWWMGKGGLRVCATHDDTPHGKLLHISFSYANKMPHYWEVKHLREAFFPLDVDVMQVFPAQHKFFNMHPFCLHLLQSPIDWQVRLG
jgi:hypothetical protein